MENGGESKKSNRVFFVFGGRGKKGTREWVVLCRRIRGRLY